MDHGWIMNDLCMACDGFCMDHAWIMQRIMYGFHVDCA